MLCFLTKSSLPWEHRATIALLQNDNALGLGPSSLVGSLTNQLPLPHLQCFQVIFGQSTLLFPCGVHSRACLVVFVTGLPRM